MRRPRRRPPHRRPAPPHGEQPTPPRVRRLLQRAHRQMENGQHADAAQIFEQLARSAEDRGNVQRTPGLYLQAARANILAGDLPRGMTLMKTGLGILQSQQRWPALLRAGQRASADLQEFGHPEEAQHIQTWLNAVLPERSDANGKAEVRPERGLLPLKCPFCGGVLRPDDVEMLDAVTGECPYCGSAVRQE